MGVLGGFFLSNISASEVTLFGAVEQIHQLDEPLDQQLENADNIPAVL
jgi:hypothetical protein